MELYRLINLICLCVVNGFFTLAGIFLNSVVIISLWKSSQLRRKTCYFMILVLSCFDLALVMIGHPTIILQSVIMSLASNTAIDVGKILIRMHWSLQGFSFCALLTMNIDRYIAILHPFFYQVSATKRRLLKLMLLLQLVTIISLISFSIPSLKDISFIIALVYIAMSLLLIVFMNCRMFMIAKNKRQVKIETKKSTPDLKGNSTCLLVIACFFICTFPYVLYCGLKFGPSITDARTTHDVLDTFRLWAITLQTMNSSVNCVIFAWRNRILNNEIKKMLSAFKHLLC